MLQIPGADACAEKLSQFFFVLPGGGFFEHGEGALPRPRALLAAARQAAIDALPEPEAISQHLLPVPGARQRPDSRPCAAGCMTSRTVCNAH
ncbi:MAG: hypothetical protein IPJ99_00385 [Betaproteobacteria bacterium]|nr:hypothetical protein [Betaproteobacteria bacterium]